MILISWNIQWGRGVDGRVDLPRIVEVARAMADFDVLCLQEVADNYPALAGAGTANQFSQLAALLPAFHAVEGVAVERWTPGLGRQRFGNLMLCRQPPLQVLRHQLPWPGDPHQPSMPRMALEAVLPAPGGPLRVMTTHLEYYATGQRAAQFDFLRHRQAEAGGPAQGQRPDKAGTPFEARPRGSRAVLCGDFNCAAGDPMIEGLQRPEGGKPGWCDAWPLAHPGQPHAMTLGLHDKVQWPDGAQCFDFFFVSQDMAYQVERFEVQQATQASDHQPVLLELGA